MEQTRISLCMIVRDEEHCIAQAIQSVAPIVSEVIVVDTGSRDRTREIARELHAQVMITEWCDDFATPRNLGIAQATGDWILVLDADEAIDVSQHELLRSCTRDPGGCYSLVQRHYTDDFRLSGFTAARGEYPHWERSYRGYFESSLCRFFPNNRGVQYVGRIHELVEPSIAKLPGLRIIETPILLHHFGHTPEVLERKNKNTLYKALGERKLEELPQDWKAFFELGVECNRPDQREQSVEAFKKSLALKADYLPTWINLGYVLCELGRCTEAIDCLIEALKLDRNSSEAHCNLCVAFMRTNDFARAEVHARRAIALDKGYLNAYVNLSTCLAHQGRLPEAILVHERALEISPDNPRIVGSIGKLYAYAGERGVARHFLTRALQLDPFCEDVRICLERL
jgi:tetratricopeptide (TPR) repeat protein